MGPLGLNGHRGKLRNLYCGDDFALLLVSPIIVNTLPTACFKTGGTVVTLEFSSATIEPTVQPKVEVHGQIIPATLAADGMSATFVLPDFSEISDESVKVSFSAWETFWTPQRELFLYKKPQAVISMKPDCANYRGGARLEIKSDDLPKSISGGSFVVAFDIIRRFENSNDAHGPVCVMVAAKRNEHGLFCEAPPLPEEFFPASFSARLSLDGGECFVGNAIDFGFYDLNGVKIISEPWGISNLPVTLIFSGERFCPSRYACCKIKDTGALVDARMIEGGAYRCDINPDSLVDACTDFTIVFSLNGTDWSDEIKVTVHPKPEVSAVESVVDKKKNEPIAFSSGMTLQLSSAQNIDYAKSGIKIKFTLLPPEVTEKDLKKEQAEEELKEAVHTADLAELPQVAALLAGLDIKPHVKVRDFSTTKFLSDIPR